jgi:hypothetical protein
MTLSASARPLDSSRSLRPIAVSKSFVWQAILALLCAAAMWVGGNFQAAAAEPAAPPAAPITVTP